MQDGMEFFMDSYLPEIPKERNFPYLKLFYLLPKLKELNLSISDFLDWKKSSVRKDLENRIHILLDFILEKELFLSWRDCEIDWITKEIDSLVDFGGRTSKMYEFREKIIEGTHLYKLHKVLDVLFLPEYPNKDTGFFDKMISVIWGIREERSYKRWNREEYVHVLKSLDALLLSPYFNQCVFFR